ncbi:Rho GTPase activation protein [Zopfochytrium polystomum]|nr:Rho GTPase activation protein [Zopfochytrium polystomum]
MGDTAAEEPHHHLVDATADSDQSPPHAGSHTVPLQSGDNQSSARKQLGKSQTSLSRNSTHRSVANSRSSLNRGHSLQRSVSDVLRRKTNVSPEGTGVAGSRVLKGDSNSQFGSKGKLARKDLDGGKSYGDLNVEEFQLLSATALKRLNALFKQYSIKPLPADTMKQVLQTCGMSSAKKKWWVPPWKKDKDKEKDREGKDTTVLKAHLCKSIDYASVPCESDQSARRLPVIGYECINYIRAHGLKSNGLFRVNGSERRMNQLAAVFDVGPTFGLGLTFAGYTIYDVADLLKKFVRGLPEPLLTTELYPHFLKCLDLPVEGAVRVKAFRWLLMLLPPPHLVLFEFLLELFSQVDQFSSENQMTASNLARIFSPNVLRPRGSEKQALEEFQTASFVVEFMIENWEQFALTGPEMRPFELMDVDYMPKKAYTPHVKTPAVVAHAATAAGSVPALAGPANGSVNASGK